MEDDSATEFSDGVLPGRVGICGDHLGYGHSGRESIRKLVRAPALRRRERPSTYSVRGSEVTESGRCFYIF